MSQPSYEMDTMSGPSRADTKYQPAVLDNEMLKTPISSPNPEPLANGSKRSTWRVTFILVALFLSLFLAALDATIISTALPVMAHDLQSATGYTWVGGAYLLANCAAGPIWAKLSDIWGRRVALLSGITFFTVGSLVCALAKRMSTLIVGRAIQGSAGGALIMLVHICISDLFSVRQRSLILGLTEGVWAIAGGVGPVLGGVFASLVSWRWCFWINLPLCGIAFTLILLFLDIKHEHTSFAIGMKAIDWFGITAFLGFTMMILLGLDFGGAIYPWSSAKVVALLVAGSILIFAFIYSEARVAKYPLIPLGLFKRRSNVAALLVTFFHGFVFMNAEYYLPLFFQSVLNTTPLISGLLLLPCVVFGAIAGVIGGVVIHRTGRFCELIWIGTFLLCLGTGLYITWGVNVSIATIVGTQIIGGVGSGLLFEPPLIAIQSQVAQQDVATATSTFSFVRNIAVSLCVVIGGSVFQNSMDHRSKSLSDAGIPPSVVDQLSGKNAAANVMIANTLTESAQVHAVKESFAWSIRNMFILCTVLGFLGFAAGLLVKKSHLAEDHVETVTGIAATEKRSEDRPDQQQQQQQLST